MIPAIHFCTQCGQPVTRTVPEGDNRVRHVCEACGAIQYQNPKIVSGCIPYWEDHILICKRAIEPRRGFWTIPAGYLEIGETVEEGAHRETWEEARTRVRDLSLYQVTTLPRIGQVYVIFTGRLADPEDFGVGEESLDARLAPIPEIPWEELAFKVVSRTLERFIREREQGSHTLQLDSIERKW